MRLYYITIMMTRNNTEIQTFTASSSDLEMQRFVVVSYNLHGFNQGYPGIRDLINTLSPEVIMLQEHWLYPSKLSKLNSIASDYVSCGSSAMMLMSGIIIGPSPT